MNSRLEGLIVKNFQDALDLKRQILENPDFITVCELVSDKMVTTFRSGGRVFFCGNGGSAADAQHFAAELSGHYLIDRPPLAAEVLHGNPSHLTAVGNDYGYEYSFARALEGSGKSGDLVVALSTSGNSPTVLKVAEVAKALGITVCAFTGNGGGALASVADISVVVPSNHVGRIQEIHGVLLHAISEYIELALFS